MKGMTAWVRLQGQDEDYGTAGAVQTLLKINSVFSQLFHIFSNIKS
jgi:hypothetical protein